MESYRIRRHDEETQCDQCGSPLYIGDGAYLTADLDVTCSFLCGRSRERTRAAQRNTRKNSPQFQALKSWLGPRYND